jgi:hypothetical protein
MLTVHTQIAQLSTPDLIIAETDRSAQNGGNACVRRSVAYDKESPYPDGPGPGCRRTGLFSALPRCPWPRGHEPAARREPDRTLM